MLGALLLLAERLFALGLFLRLGGLIAEDLQGVVDLSDFFLGLLVGDVHVHLTACDLFHETDQLVDLLGDDFADAKRNSGSEKNRDQRPHRHGNSSGACERGCLFAKDGAAARQFPAHVVDLLQKSGSDLVHLGTQTVTLGDDRTHAIDCRVEAPKARPDFLDGRLDARLERCVFQCRHRFVNAQGLLAQLFQKRGVVGQQEPFGIEAGGEEFLLNHTGPER